MHEEEPLNVQVARALVIGNLWKRKDGTWEYEHWNGWSPGPDYLHDKAWLWDVEEKNELVVDVARWADGFVCHVSENSKRFSEFPNGFKGSTRAEAILRWVIAAKKAGIEVRP